MWIEIIFWSLLAIVFYSYLGYGIVLYILVSLKRLFKVGKRSVDLSYQPDVTLFVTAFNEMECIDMKIQNSLQLNYPKDKLKLIWVTDGSDDGTPEYIRKNYPEVEVYHRDAREGKIVAMNRGAQFVTTPIIVFSDANTTLGLDSIKIIVELFSNDSVGCVSGEKRIAQQSREAASAAGEGLYWRYESLLKRWDAELYSAVGAAGELFAVRRDLFRPVEKDTLLDDFIISLRIAMQGYRIEYNPEAYSVEMASASVEEELKRKIRISAGGLQSIGRLSPLLNIFKYGVLSFQYISHRVLRWTVAPLALPLIFILNVLLASQEIYLILLCGQLLFYIAALIGWRLESSQIRVKALFVPYYFTMMNYSIYRGALRLIKAQQSVKWERAKRADVPK